MNTTEVVTVLAENRNLSKAETRRLLDVAVQTFNDKLAQGKSFSVPELGTFSTHTRESRRSFNPHYRQYIQLPPKRVVRFNPSKGLKEDAKQMEINDE